ncbi:unnamed protein product [Arabidopsis halleri]
MTREESCYRSPNTFISASVLIKRWRSYSYAEVKRDESLSNEWIIGKCSEIPSICSQKIQKGVRF